VLIEPSNAHRRVAIIRPGAFSDLQLLMSSKFGYADCRRFSRYVHENDTNRPLLLPRGAVIIVSYLQH